MRGREGGREGREGGREGRLWFKYRYHKRRKAFYLARVKEGSEGMEFTR